MAKKYSQTDIGAWLLRIGLAAVFLYAAISSLQHPLEWVGFLPLFIIHHVSSVNVLRVLAVYELVLVVWLLSGKYIAYCGLVCAVTLFGIVIVNPSQLITTFRDIGLGCMALALYFFEK